MIFEDELPRALKEAAVALPSGQLTWRRKDIERVLEEAASFDVAIAGIQIWVLDEGQLKGLIPLKNGDIKAFIFKVTKNSHEEWIEYVLRSTKSTQELLNKLDMEKAVQPDYFAKVYYSLHFSTDD
jgi:hypothetical protein